MAKNAWATPSQFPQESQKLVYGCGGGNLDWGGDPKVVEGGEGLPVPGP